MSLQHHASSDLGVDWHPLEGCALQDDATATGTRGECPDPSPWLGWQPCSEDPASDPVVSPAPIWPSCLPEVAGRPAGFGQGGVGGGAPAVATSSSSERPMGITMATSAKQGWVHMRPRASWASAAAPGLATAMIPALGGGPTGQWLTWGAGHSKGGMPARCAVVLLVQSHGKERGEPRRTGMGGGVPLTYMYTFQITLISIE